MRIYLIQHGKAKSGEEDPQKPLTEEGKMETGEIASRLKGRIHLEKIYCSKKLRAKQTADILAGNLGISTQEAEGLNPLDDIRAALDLISDGAAFVGHLPFLNKLASRLLANDESADIVKFSHSGVLCIEKTDGRKWQIAWYLLPDASLLS